MLSAAIRCGPSFPLINNLMCPTSVLEELPSSDLLRARVDTGTQEAFSRPTCRLRSPDRGGESGKTGARFIDICTSGQRSAHDYARSFLSNEG